MDLRTTIAELYAEKTRIDQVIASLEQLGDEPLPVSITAPRRGRKFMSPQERREVSERMRRYWAGRKWLSGEQVVHDLSHVHPLKSLKLPEKAAKTGEELAGQLRRQKAILGVFDEGCMGMYNGIIEDCFLLPLGVGKERLSQSALYAEMLATPDAEALAVRAWLDAKGMRFLTGSTPAPDLTDAQILDQCKMYIAALRIADDFGCDV